MTSKYDSYNIEDFICDESFQRWANGQASAAEQMEWEEIYSTHPNKEIVTQARNLVTQLTREEAEIDGATIEASWQKLEARIDRPVISLLSLRQVRYAAVVAIVAFTSLFFYLNMSSEPDYLTYTSGYGELKTVLLDDGTEVTLSANSEIKVPVGWAGTLREVWLEKGEAFFEVVKTEEQSKFQVHTDKVDITVLGTKFDVNLRTPQTKVVLTEGKVRINSGDQELLMNPGDMVVYNEGALSKQQVKVSQFDAWRRNKLIMDNTSLTELKAIMEAYYGVNVKVDPSVADKRMSGELPNNNLNLLLQALEITLSLDVEHGGDTIKIMSSKE